ncbi:MAG: hypothetical protein EPN97_02790 [Alphaproteobacteria bacterium]|nr:MAG: hypothetical protein EPN97_02790 [Alphaproteobacteria bacterium]
MQTIIKVFFLACFLLMQQMPAARAETDACPMPDGYIDRGIGGTGLTGTNGDDGIGGTGIDNRKAGPNTASTIYVIGTIYAYGSLCVNGLHITYADDTPVKDGAGTSSAKELQLGQLVQVEAEKTPGVSSLKARKISLIHMLEGPVSGVSPETGTIEVMGESIRLADLSGYPQLSVGLGVRVGGLRDLKGRIVATSIVAKGAKQPDRVAGHLTMDEKEHMLIGKTPITLPKGVKLPPSGEDLVAVGAWRDNSLHVTRVSEKPDDDFAPGYISLEGYIEHVPDAHHAQVCDEVFNTDGLKDARFREGDRVIVTGVIGKDGKLDAIDLKDVKVPGINVLGSDKDKLQ